MYDLYWRERMYRCPYAHVRDFPTWMFDIPEVRQQERRAASKRGWRAAPLLRRHTDRRIGYSRPILRRATPTSVRTPPGAQHLETRSTGRKAGAL